MTTDPSRLTLLSYLQKMDKSLSTYGASSNSNRTRASDTTAKLLKRALSKSSNPHRLATSPIRTLHHLSCTGGTMITKCIASMPNTLVLNEVDPLSPLARTNKKAAFTPNNISSLIRQGDRNISDKVLIELFIQQLQLVHAENHKIGRALVLREHSHSHFLTGDKIPDRPTILEMLRPHFEILPLVMVRDPIDSYISVVANNWHTLFQPGNFEEYCKRYCLFLDNFKNITILKYENFVETPNVSMKEISEELNLTYSPTFVSTFSSFRFSGDSGRSGSVISPRERRPIPDHFLQEVRASKTYPKLASRLKYTDFRKSATTDLVTG